MIKKIAKPGCDIFEKTPDDYYTYVIKRHRINSYGVAVETLELFVKNCPVETGPALEDLILINRNRLPDLTLIKDDALGEAGAVNV